MKRYLIIFLVFILSQNLFAESHDIYPFSTEVEQQHFNQLLGELRCLVCQNEDLGASNATLAADLRRQVYERMQQHQSDTEIKQYLVDRYGEFILYKPQVEKNTLLLWLAPLILVVLGFSTLGYFIRKQQNKE